jgi:hypothetical protein
LLRDETVLRNVSRGTVDIEADGGADLHVDDYTLLVHPTLHEVGIVSEVRWVLLSLACRTESATIEMWSASEGVLGKMIADVPICPELIARVNRMSGES